MKFLKCVLLFLYLVNTFALYSQVSNNIHRGNKTYEKSPSVMIVYARDSLQQIAKYHESIKQCLQVLDTSISPKALYFMAINYAKLNLTDSAFIYLHRYVNVSTDDRIILVDRDFDNLRMQKTKWEALETSIINAYIQELENITNTELAIQLFYLGILDQKYRVYLPILGQLDTNSTKEDIKNEIRIDSIFREIITIYGFPTVSMTGHLGSSNAFYLLQHTSRISKKYYTMAKIAYKKGDFNPMYYAMLTDRYLLQRKKKQLFGTQFYWDIKKTEKKYPGKSILWPVKDFRNVNERREQIGFSYTVEENAKRNPHWHIPVEYYK